MLCNICGKKEATVHLTEIINDQMTKLNLCEDCAREKGAEMEEHFGLSELLAGLTDMGGAVEQGSGVTTKCQNCGMTYQNFRKLGRLGCSVCYDTFKKELSPLLKRIHGSDRHVGKVPLKGGKTIKDTRTLQDLKMQLEKAIQTEEFEEAAKLRDKIRDLEAKRSKEE
jgi:protein arginine kinase activator